MSDSLGDTWKLVLSRYIPDEPGGDEEIGVTDVLVSKLRSGGTSPLAAAKKCRPRVLL